jgi:lambda repressor-like predicted transcriptional regulator
MASMTAAALANSELTHITASLHATGVPVRELANAAGVTYRAMARRLGKTKGNTNTK